MSLQQRRRSLGVLIAQSVPGDRHGAAGGQERALADPK
jgi:hypothetical protein